VSYTRTSFLHPTYTSTPYIPHIHTNFFPEPNIYSHTHILTLTYLQSAGIHELWWRIWVCEYTHELWGRMWVCEYMLGKDPLHTCSHQCDSLRVCRRLHRAKGHTRVIHTNFFVPRRRDRQRALRVEIFESQPHESQKKPNDCKKY